MIIGPFIVHIVEYVSPAEEMLPFV